jgi:hypothetical protein
LDVGRSRTHGRFHWNDLDAVVAYWNTRNKQLVVRLWVTTDPGWAGAPGNNACPDWLWDAGVKFHEYKGEDGVLQRCPACAEASWEKVYLPKLKRLLTAYRDRYHQAGSAIILDHETGVKTVDSNSSWAQGSRAFAALRWSWL